MHKSNLGVNTKLIIIQPPFTIKPVGMDEVLQAGLENELDVYVKGETTPVRGSELLMWTGL